MNLFSFFVLFAFFTKTRKTLFVIKKMTMSARIEALRCFISFITEAKTCLNTKIEIRMNTSQIIIHSYNYKRIFNFLRTCYQKYEYHSW